jgi:hypothetical protein
MVHRRSLTPDGHVIIGDSATIKHIQEKLDKSATTAHLRERLAGTPKDPPPPPPTKSDEK